MRAIAGACVGAATLVLTLSYAGQALWAGAGIGAAIGLLWSIGQWRGAHWPTDLYLAGWVGLAAFGAWQGVSAGWMLVAMIAALAAWDLDRFAERLHSAGRVIHPTDLARAHLRQLAIVVGVGLVLGFVALGLRIELTFGWALLVAGLAIYSLSRLIGAGRDAEQ
ncbi:MAG TPA: hypothetical protein VFU22_27320 [Roseiflexaceae bacterium]|nr:hypothetical protein [Roseiflexaceae bacterium]